MTSPQRYAAVASDGAGRNAMGLFERLTADLHLPRGVRCARCAMTTHIAQQSRRACFPQRDRGAGRQVRRRAGAALRSRDASAIANSPRAPTAMRAGRWRRASRKGDTVCLLMPNRPEFLAIWLGITRVGGVVALLNTNLTGTALAPLHQRRRAEAHHRRRRAAAARCRPAQPQLTGNAKVWLHGDGRRRPAAHRPRGRCACPASRSPTRSAARSPSRTARCSSTPPAPPACPRPPTSTTTG